MPIVEGVSGPKVATAEYDFAVDGGAVSAITMRSVATDSVGAAIPAGAVILGGYVDLLTAFTTGTAATLALSIEGANDLIAATVVSGAPYSTTGRKAVVPVFTAATMIKTTVPRSPVATIAVGTITAGKLRVVLLYI